MDKVRNYFQRHPVLHWLMSVAVTSCVLTGVGLLLHEKDWLFLIGMSVVVPAIMAVLRGVQKR